MPRPEDLELAASEHPWVAIPMEGATVGIDVVPLASIGESFTVLCRFPAGFERMVAGGYFASEEFVLLSGELELEQARYQPGDVAFIPANFLRTRMTTSVGALVLAWFSGPAVFRSESELGQELVETGISSSTLSALAEGAVLDLPSAHWSLREIVDDQDATNGNDLVDLGLQRWIHVSAQTNRDELRGRFLERAQKIAQ